MFEIQKINFPADCRIVHHEFYNYDPDNSFDKDHSSKLLNEDLLQCSFPLDHLIIDLGWYGDIPTNKGEFRIYIIQHENWEVPFNVIHSKSATEAAELLSKILQYYTRVNAEVENSQ